jgi:predicted TPR repeat methyltransferase
LSTPTARGARSAAQGILADDRTQQRDQIVAALKKAYWMEIETVMSYIANSVNPDGVRAQEIIESLQADIQEELGHAQQFATGSSRAPRSSPRSSIRCSRPSTRPTSST